MMQAGGGSGRQGPDNCQDAQKNRPPGILTACGLFVSILPAI
jgi:hypothetical protein